MSNLTACIVGFFGIPAMIILFLQYPWVGAGVFGFFFAVLFWRGCND